MSQLVTISVFLISRLGVELRVVFRSSGLVKIEPYQCRDENLRLWSSISQTQTAWAQVQLATCKGEEPPVFLQALFRNSGWDVKALEERNEFSL